MAGRRSVVGLVCAAGVLLSSATGFALAASQDGSASAAFQPWASSFVSASTGFVLGGVGCRFGVNGAQRPCKPVVVTTSDRGGSWHRLSAPPALLQWLVTPAGGPDVRAITFADSHDGWLYGPGLWATHDGGAHWTRTAVKGLVMSVVTGGGWAYAAVVGPRSAGAASVLRSPVGRDDWKPVRSLAGSVASGDGGWLLAASGGSLWAGTLPVPNSTSAPELWRSADGAPWQRLGNPCGSGSLASLTASSASDLVMLCGGRALQIAASSDGGVHTQRVPAPATSVFGPLAAPLNTRTTIVFAYPLRLALSASVPPPPSPSSLDRTADGGRSWTRSPYSDHGVGWADLQFSSPGVGWVIHGFPGASVDQLMQTTDAGATFKPVRL